ncbi:MAG TPA: hypothetical protein VM238_22035 [Phycisphaerae bacterium]|nr:hypothetical protein [Phycisphaerae bacterium]
MRYLSLALLLAFVMAFVVGCAEQPPEEAKCPKCGCVLDADGKCPKCDAEPAPDAAKEPAAAVEEAADAAKGALEKAADEAKKAVEEKM